MEMSAPQRVSPGATSQQDPFGKVTYNAVPGLAGEAPAGTMWDGQAYVATPGAQVKTEGPFAPGSVVSYEPNGKPTIVQQPQFSVKDAGEVLQDIGTSEPFKAAAKSGEMYRSIVQAAQRPGGIPDAELKDTAAQVLSGGVARQFGAKMLEEGGGPLARVRQFGPQILSGQALAPEVRQAIVQAVRDKAIGDDASYRTYVKARAGYSAASGQDITPYANGLLKFDLPDVPSLASIPNGGGGGGNGGFGGLGSGGGGAGPVAGPQARLTPAQAAALKPGTGFYGLDGRWRVRH